MSQEAKYANGESILSQVHATGNIEPAYANGESGNIPFDEYVAGGGGSIKTVDGLVKASVKTVGGLAIGSVKSIDGLQ